MIFYQGGKINHGTHVPGPFNQSSAESEYNASCTAEMVLANFRMWIHKFLNKDPDIVPEEDPLIILNSKYAVFMDNNGKDTKHIRNIVRIIYFVGKDENCNMHKIDRC